MSDNIENEDDASGFGLGRGLDALFGDDEVVDADDEQAFVEAMESEERDAEEAENGVKDSGLGDTDAQDVSEAVDRVSENDDVADDASFDAGAQEAVQTRDDVSSNAGNKRLVLPIENLYPSAFQPRKIFHEDSINELASSIRQYGVLQPLLVRKDPANDYGYEIIAGERRWRASQKAQLHELPVVILEIDELEAYKIALIENLQREDIDPIDEAYGYQKLLEDFGQTQEQLAEAVGKSRPHITNTLRLLQLDNTTQTFLCEKKISMGHARALIGVDNAEDIVKKVVKQGLSVRQTEKLAAVAKGVEQTKRPRNASPVSSAPAQKDADTTALENDISNALGMNVSIDSTDGKSGTLSVEFKTLDQLDEVLHRLAHFPGSRLSG